VGKNVTQKVERWAYGGEEIRRREDSVFLSKLESGSGKAHLVGMTIALARDVEEFVKAQVRSGVCSDASDLVNDVLRAIRDQQSGCPPISPELEAWLLEAADAPAQPLTAADFADIRERARAKINPAQK